VMYVTLNLAVAGKRSLLACPAVVPRPAAVRLGRRRIQPGSFIVALTGDRKYLGVAIYGGLPPRRIA
jgi:hypothetical protein